MYIYYIIIHYSFYLLIDYAYLYQINILPMSFSVSKQLMLMVIKCVSIAFILLTFMFFCVMAFYIHNNNDTPYLPNNTNNNSITTTLNKLFTHEHTSSSTTTSLCGISLCDCSLALLLGLYISTKQLRLLGVL
jgi:hypothetical protein